MYVTLPLLFRCPGCGEIWKYQRDGTPLTLCVNWYGGCEDFNIWTATLSNCLPIGTIP